MSLRLRPAFALVLLAFALAACDGAGEPPFLAETVTPADTASPAASPEPTPSPSPAAAPESGGSDGFRAFAARIAAAVADADGAFFADRGLQGETTCDGTEELGPCAGQAAGTVLRGIPSAIVQSDAFAYFTPEEYAAVMGDWFGDARGDLADEYGGGAPALYALAADGADTHLAIVTAIVQSGPATLRQARILSFQFLDGRWRLTLDLYATVAATADAYLSGACADCYDSWERWGG